MPGEEGWRHFKQKTQLKKHKGFHILIDQILFIIKVVMMMRRLYLNEGGALYSINIK